MFLLKDNCFTEFCCFLSNLKMNQPQCTYIPSILNLPPISLPISPLQVDTESLFEFLESYSKFPLAIYFIYGNVSFHVTLSIHLTLLSPLLMSISLFSVSISPLLPCKQILQYHFSRLCIYELENSIYLFLTHFTLYNGFQVHPTHQN